MTINIVEVGPRDGLQNELHNIPTAMKLALIERLVAAGLKTIEVTSFVSPKWVPQMADHSTVLASLPPAPDLRYLSLVPNLHGLHDAIAAGAKTICVFTAASEPFSQHNTNCSIEESLHRIRDIVTLALEHNIAVRGYISCTLGCPYAGKVPVSRVATLAEQLVELGCYQVSLGDTIGVGTAAQAKSLVSTVARAIPINQLAVHFHDTYAQALTNIYVSLEQGVTTVDSSVAGLGGCPYAPGAGGNVATEDVVYLLEGLGISTGIDLNALAAAGRLICDFLQQPPRSKVSIALAQATYGD